MVAGGSPVADGAGSETKEMLNAKGVVADISLMSVVSVRNQ